MNQLQQTNQTTDLSVQIEQKRTELTNVLQQTILAQYAYDLKSNTPESFKKKQEVAKFVSQLVNTKDKTGRPAIMSCTQDSIIDCCITYCNNELNFFRNQAYLFPFGNKLSFMIGKDGYVAMAKQLNPDIEDFYYEVVYKKDEFEYSKIAGKTQITKHIQKLENVTCKIEDIVCAYATCVYKNGNHEADIMTIQEIINALKTAQKGGFSDTHKLNPRIMLSKFPLRRLAKRKINQSANEEVRRSFVYEDDEVVANQSYEIPNMAINLDENQGFEVLDEAPIEPEYFQTHSYDEPTEEENEIVDEEPSDEEWQMAMEEDNAEQTVSYSKWLNEYKDNGWVQVQGSYDRVNKTVRVRRA
jgi:recombinational DNA repair protein RecT